MDTQETQLTKKIGLALAEAQENSVVSKCEIDFFKYPNDSLVIN